MKQWLKEMWFTLKSFTFAFAIQMLFLCAWDWYTPHTTWGFGLPRWVTYIAGTTVFCLAHGAATLWHRWRKRTRSL